MDVILTRGVGIRGEGHSAGERLTLTDEDAKTLIQMGKADAAPQAESPPSETESAKEVTPAETVSAETVKQPGKSGRSSRQRTS